LIGNQTLVYALEDIYWALFVRILSCFQEEMMVQEDPIELEKMISRRKKWRTPKRSKGSQKREEHGEGA